MIFLSNPSVFQNALLLALLVLLLVGQRLQMSLVIICVAFGLMLFRLFYLAYTVAC